MVIDLVHDLHRNYVGALRFSRILSRRSESIDEVFNRRSAFSPSPYLLSFSVLFFPFPPPPLILSLGSLFLRAFRSPLAIPRNGTPIFAELQ